MNFSTLLATAGIFSVFLIGCGPTNRPIEPPPPGYICNYEFQFTHQHQCAAYTGDGWSEISAADNCANVLTSTGSDFLLNAQCRAEGILGSCTFGYGTPEEYIEFYYDDVDIALLESFCGSFDGIWSSDGTITPPVESDFAPEVVTAMSSTTEVAVSPADCLETDCLDTVVAARSAFTFSPTAAATTGFILFPGGGVDPRAYAPVAQRIANEGYFVAIVAFPGNFALNEHSRADDIKTANPSITNWYLGGHSVGGTAAASYLFNGGAVDGLLLWSSFPNELESLSTSAVPMASLYGTHDSTGPVQIEETKHLLPTSTEYVEVLGGNHGQFGYFGLHDGDGVATIGYEQQQDMVADTTIYFMRSIANGGIQSAHPGFTTAQIQNEAVCQDGQRFVGDVDSNLLPNSNIGNEMMLTFDDFSGGRSTADISANPQVEIKTHVFYQGNNNVLNAPPIIDSQVMCKVKSKEGLVDKLNLAVGPATNECEALNQAAFNWALAQLSPAELTSYQNSGKSVSFLGDTAFGTGVEFLGADLQTDWLGLNLQISAPHLKVAIDAGLSDELMGVIYCKTWSPAAALAYLLGGTL